MLNDSISDVFQSLMLKEQPESNGLQDPVLAQNMFFTVHHHNPFVQILYDGKLHWITVSTYWCEPGKVFHFDSLCSLVEYLKKLSNIGCNHAFFKADFENTCCPSSTAIKWRGL